MASVKCIILVVLMALAMVAALPMPDPLFFGPKHEHVVIHVPQHVHTVNHHIVHKVPVYIHKEPEFHGWY